MNDKYIELKEVNCFFYILFYFRESLTILLFSLNGPAKSAFLDKFFLKNLLKSLKKYNKILTKFEKIMMLLYP